MRRIILFCIKVYQRFISPLFPSHCRFHPTCSEYARQAVNMHGFVRGALLTLWRIMRCHPLCAGGNDPVPPMKRPSN